LHLETFWYTTPPQRGVSPSLVTPLKPPGELHAHFKGFAFEVQLFLVRKTL